MMTNISMPTTMKSSTTVNLSASAINLNAIIGSMSQVMFRFTVRNAMPGSTVEDIKFAVMTFNKCVFSILSGFSPVLLPNCKKYTVNEFSTSPISASNPNMNPVVNTCTFS